ncbi:hypothetical protein E4T43_08730 [Aureobasidium subglaciale]|nr:hypothetical protein E4T43_08730 [Aureobasidium subglaciale]
MAVLEATVDDEIHLLLVWPIEVDAEYLTALSTRDPLALIILAQHAVLISLRPNAWWAANWPAKILESVTAALDKWPRAKVFRHITSFKSLFTYPAKLKALLGK